MPFPLTDNLHVLNELYYEFNDLVKCIVNFESYICNPKLTTIENRFNTY